MTQRLIAYSIFLSLSAFTAKAQTEQIRNDEMLYNLKGHVAECIISTVYDTWTGSETVTFNRKGAITQGLSFSYQYKNDGLTLESISPALDHWGNVQIDISRNSDGRITDIQSFKDSNSTDLGSYPTQEMRFTYNTQGQLATQQTLIKDELQAKEIYTYNEDGTVATCALLFGNGSQIVTKYEYKSFDSHGNWTKRIGTDSTASSLPTIETRQITYWD